MLGVEDFPPLLFQNLIEQEVSLVEPVIRWRRYVGREIHKLTIFLNIDSTINWRN
jgi:hypothetical protein